MIQNRVDECYALKDNKSALDCLKRVVQEPSACQSRLVLFTQTNCPGCKSELKRHKQDVSEGLIEEVNIDSPEGLAIAKKNNIDFVPALVVLDCHDNLIEPSV